MKEEELKRAAAKKALNFIEDDMIVGVGTGSTVNYFIEALASMKHRIDATVASSKTTEALLRSYGIPVIDLNTVNELPIYVDGADEVNPHKELLKGGGGALTREKIIAAVAKNFVCIVDASKQVNRLGGFPLAIEVLPIARSFVAREIVKLGGDPSYREGFVTDNGNIILDIYNLNIDVPIQMEDTLNSIPGVVENGIFAKRVADAVIVSSDDGIKIFK